jgi:hypothetical protein
VAEILGCLRRVGKCISRDFPLCGA